MTKNEIIYVAKPTRYTEQTYPGHTKFYEHFVSQLREYHEVRALELPDIWVRDFLPVQNVQTGELYQQFLTRAMPIIRLNLRRLSANRYGALFRKLNRATCV